MNCIVCGAPPEEFPMCFRGGEYCSDDCRKVIVGEKQPTHAQEIAMDHSLFMRIGEDGFVH